MSGEKMKRLLLTLGMTCMATLAHPMDENLVNCRHTTGIKMPADECALFQRLELKKEADAERSQAAAVENRALEAKLQKERDDKAAQDKEAYAASLAEDREASAKRAAAFEAQRAEEDRQAAAEARKSEARAATRKAACGKDYLNPQIGMAIERAQQCVGAFKVSAQLNKADGVVTTYRGNSTYLHVMSGRIVSWGRY